MLATATCSSTHKRQHKITPANADMTALSRSLLVNERKPVSATAMRRLKTADAAIDYTKRHIPHAGNQKKGLVHTKMLSRYRNHIVRKPECWEFVSAETESLAKNNPRALNAAKATIVNGGNCGQHTDLTYTYLRVHAKGETIHVAHSGDDHSFALLGPLAALHDSELIAADAWPVMARAVLCEDHFAYRDRPTEITIEDTRIADGEGVVDLVAAGLKLSLLGEKMLEVARDDSELLSRRGVRRAIKDADWVQDRQFASTVPVAYESTQD